MSSVALTQRSPSPSPPFEHQQPFFLFRWLHSAWFPWAWMALWAGAQAGHALVSRHFFTTGAGLLSSDEIGAGLHLYATHPELQIGPLTFLAAAPLNGLATWLSGAIAAVTIAATAPAMLQSLSRLPGLTISARQRGLAAAVLMPVWAELAVHYAHLDDALALVLLVAAIHAVARSRPLAAALLLAASAGAKPWALAFVPLLLVLPRVRWRRAAAVWLGGGRGGVAALCPDRPKDAACQRIRYPQRRILVPARPGCHGSLNPALGSSPPAALGGHLGGDRCTSWPLAGGACSCAGGTDGA